MSSDEGIATAVTVAIRAMQAEEALCSSEIEGIVLSPRERWKTKCRMIWPNLTEEELEILADFDEQEKKKCTSKKKTTK